VEVVEVGSAVGAVEVGALALPSFQVSCGSCPRCRRGKSAICSEYPLLSDYGMEPLSGVEYGGMLSDLVRVPNANTMLTPLPAAVDPIAAASVPDNVLDGYRSVAPHLERCPGADVLIACHGIASIGLYAAHSATVLGAASVTVASADESVLRLADELGARPLRVDFTERSAEKWPIVVDCGLETNGFQWAVRATEPEGVLHSVSSYLEDTVSVPLRRLYTLGIEFHIGRAHSAALLPEVAALVESGRLHPELVTTCVIGWNDAADRFLEPTIKLIIERWSEEA
jgi:alcohol dehydrogenase